MCSSSKFKLPGGSFGSNILHYRGAPFVPNPETLYDGGTGSQTYASIGKQGTPIGGSTYTGKRCWIRVARPLFRKRSPGWALVTTIRPARRASGSIASGS